MAALPTLMRLGVASLGLSLLADVIAHLEAADHVIHGHLHTSAAMSAHVGVLVGMVLIFAGVVIDGVRQTRLRRSAERPSKGVA